MIERTFWEKGGRKGFDREEEISAKAKFEETQARYEKEHPESVRSIRERIGRIDLSVLQDIFAEEARKSGVPAENLNFISPDQIYILPAELFTPPSTPMVFGPNINSIVINGGIHHSLPASGYNENDIQVIFLRAICHEYAHAMGLLRDGTGSDKVSYVYSGYFRASTFPGAFPRHDVTLETARLFNEGVTELIARRVTEEYLRRAPMALPDGTQLNLIAYKKLLETQIPGWPVDYERRVAYVFSERLCEHLALLSGVGVEKVREALIAGYFNHATSLEFNELLDEVVGEGFSIALGDVETADEFRSIVETYEFPALPQSVSERLKQVLLNLLRGF